MKTNLVRGELACVHRRNGVEYLKLFTFMSITIMQTKWKLNNAELFVIKLFYIQSWERGNKKYYKGNKENLKNCVNICVRKEKTQGWVQYKQKLHP